MGRWTTPHASGEFTTRDHRGRKVEGQVCSCVHCQFTWEVKPGSGKQRGFCRNCMGPTCGKPECESRCIPLERRLAILHQWGRHGLQRAIEGS